MQKKILSLALCFMCAGLCACGTEKKTTDATPAESSPAAATEQTSEPTEAVQSEKTEAAQTTQTETSLPEETEASSAEQTESGSDTVTEDQALDAIKKYCFNNNPNLKDMVDSGEYNIYWTVSTNDANEIVVLYRSYTSALTRYYIDPVSGETYVTEWVSGIMDEEQRTDESFNVRDYLT